MNIELQKRLGIETQTHEQGKVITLKHKEDALQLSVNN